MKGDKMLKGILTALFVCVASQAIAGPYDGLTLDTAAGTAVRNVSGYVKVAASSNTPTTYTITIDGVNSQITAQRFIGDIIANYLSLSSMTVSRGGYDLIVDSHSIVFGGSQSNIQIMIGTTTLQFIAGNTGVGAGTNALLVAGTNGKRARIQVWGDSSVNGDLIGFGSAPLWSTNYSPGTSTAPIPFADNAAQTNIGTYGFYANSGTSGHSEKHYVSLRGYAEVGQQGSNDIAPGRLVVAIGRPDAGSSGRVTALWTSSGAYAVGGTNLASDYTPVADLEITGGPYSQYSKLFQVSYNGTAEASITKTGEANFAGGVTASTGSFSGAVSIGGGAQTMYYCNGGANAGLLGRGNGGPCSGGSWVATSFKLD